MFVCSFDEIGSEVHAPYHTNAIFVGTARTLIRCSDVPMKGNTHDEPKPTRPAEPIAGSEARSTAGRRPETRPAEPAPRNGLQEAQRAARSKQRERHRT